MTSVTKTMTAAATAVLVVFLTLGSGCSSSGYKRTGVQGSVHYRHYYGSPWRDYRRPVILVPPEDGEVDPDWGVEPPGGPEAVPLPSMPDMGMPDYGGDGGMGMDMDMGGFDW